MNKESLKMTSRVNSVLHLSLQGQNLLYIQAFDDTKRAELSTILEKEKWKRSERDFRLTLEKLESVPILYDALNPSTTIKTQNDEPENIDNGQEVSTGNSSNENKSHIECNGSVSPSPVAINNNEKAKSTQKSTLDDITPGDVVVRICKHDF